MVYQYKYILLVLFLITGCGSGESTKATSTKNLEKEIKDIGNLSQTVVPPNMPEESQATSTIEGVDENRNAIRDDVENIIYQGLKTVDTINVFQYEQILKIIKMLQPAENPSEKKINEHEIYCAYKLLPDTLQEELSLDFFYEIVLNTTQRKEAFQESLQPSTVSSGAETCE